MQILNDTSYGISIDKIKSYFYARNRYGVSVGSKASVELVAPSV